MRPLFLTFIIGIGLASCAPKGDANLAKLETTRDSLKSTRAEITAQLASVELQISELDSNRKQRVNLVTELRLNPTRFEHYFNVQGVVETDQNATLYPEAAGKITSIKVKEGERVDQGQVLMSIDSRIVSNQIDEVKSRLQLAETVFKKQESLWNQKIGSEIQFLESKNNYESLKENLNTLEAQRAMYSLTAPFSGIVDEIMPKEGEMANPAMPAVRLINMTDMYMKADVTERYLGQIKSGDSVKVRFPSIDETRATTILRMGNYINPNNRTFKIKLNLSNKDLTLKPNMLGELSVRDYVNDSTVVIPSDLIQMTPSGQEFVYVIDESSEQRTAKKVLIKSGMSHDNRSEILEGLLGNEVLINKGARTIKEGDKVQIDNE